MHFGENRMNPFLLFFHHFYRFVGSAKFETDRKSENRNNTFQFEIHYFSLNKPDRISTVKSHKMRSENIFKNPLKIEYES